VKVTSRERTYIIIGAVVVVAVLIFYVATLLVPDSQSLSQSVDIKKKMLRSQLETLSREDFYKKRLDQYKKQLDQDMTRFLPGDSPSLAGADLQKIVKDFADQSGVEITQRNIMPAGKIQDPATKVTVRMETNCNPEQLVQFLTLVENYEKLLRVDEIVMSSFRNLRKIETRTSLTISGYIALPPEKPAEKPAPKAGTASVS
jgi:hypothetical protein